MKQYDVLYEYLSKGYCIEEIGPKLLSNILEYAINRTTNQKQMNELLYQLLSGIGLTEGELEGIKTVEDTKQTDNKPFSLIKGTTTFDKYDVPKVRTSGNVFESSDCKTEIIKTFNTIEEARKELYKYNTNYYLENKDDKTMTATEYCLEEDGKKIAFSNRNFTAFVAFESEDGLKTLTKRFPSYDFGSKAYDFCNKWAKDACDFLESNLHVGIAEYGVKYIDSILTVEEYVKLYDLAHSLNCDDFWVRRRLDKNKKDYLEVTIRNCDDFKYFDVPILNDGEFEGLKLNVQYSSHELELGVEYDQADYEF